MFLLRNVFKKNLVLENMIIIIGKIYDWEYHLEVIDAILVIQDEQSKEEKKDNYIYEWNSIYFEQWVDSWNESYSKYDMVFEKENILLQFVLIKSRIYFFRENGIFVESFEQSRKIFKSEYNIEITMHNEIGRLLLKCDDFHVDCEGFVTQWTHCEVMGASEGKVEGDVKAGARIIENRFNLAKLMFGYEFTIQGSLRTHPHLEDKVNKSAAKKLYKVKGSPFYEKCKYWPSKPLWKRANKTRLSNLKGNKKLKMQQYPSMASIKANMKSKVSSNDNSNKFNDSIDVPPRKRQKLVANQSRYNNVIQEQRVANNHDIDSDDEDDDDDDDDQDVIDEMEALVATSK